MSPSREPHLRLTPKGEAVVRAPGMNPECLAICDGPHDGPHRGEYRYWSVEFSGPVLFDSELARDEVARFLAGRCPACGREPSQILWRPTIGAEKQ